MDLVFAGFDWDSGNREKCQKHGVPIAEIEALFGGEPLVAPSLRRGAGERRYIAIGRNSQGRPLFVAFTIRADEGRRLIRPISSRYMHAQEIHRYETTRS